jgi:hypothetical protein
MADRGIDFSDIPESTGEELRRARRVGRPQTAQAKQLIAIRLAPALLARLRALAHKRKNPTRHWSTRSSSGQRGTSSSFPSTRRPESDPEHLYVEVNVASLTVHPHSTARFTLRRHGSMSRKAVASPRCVCTLLLPAARPESRAARTGFLMSRS